MSDMAPGALHQTNPPMMAIGPVLQCHLCMDMVDLGVLDPEEAYPAVVVYPTKGSLCEWHRIKAVFPNLRLKPGEGRERYRQALIEEGFLPRQFKSPAEFVQYVTNHGKWTPNDDGKVEAREAVLERIIHEPGNRDQVRKGLIELAKTDHGDCPHPLGGMTTPDTCVRCLARKFLVLLDSSKGWQQTTPTTMADPG